ncbi:MAG TPA: MarR family transcriptional regulator [Nevskiaceae bacterium]|nr:MarR family transcriptional regulator [Nevskiaceae bacterium]
MRLAQVAASTPRMARALVGMPMAGTTMVRLLRIAGFGLGNFFEPAFRALGLAEHNFHVLCLLMSTETGSAAPSELAEMVGTSRPNMTRILDELAEDGWIERRAAARDGRRHVISITAAGRRKVRDTVPRIAEPIRRAFSDLSEEEFALLDRLLRKVIVSLDKGSGEMRAVA